MAEFRIEVIHIKGRMDDMAEYLNVRGLGEYLIQIIPEHSGTSAVLRMPVAGSNIKPGAEGGLPIPARGVRSR